MSDRANSFTPSDEWGSFQFTTSADAKRAEHMFNQLSSERDALAQALKDAELFLRVGHAYAPDEFVSGQHKATGEWLKTRGLATTMLRVADAAREVLSKVAAKP